MISQPMANNSDVEIQATRKQAFKTLSKKGYHIVDTFFVVDNEDNQKQLVNSFFKKDHCQDDLKFDFNLDKNEYQRLKDLKVINIPLIFLSKTIEAMATVETVYFCEGWQNARGCQVEHLVASSYGLEILYE